MLIGAAVLGIIAVFIARIALSPSAPQVAVADTASVAAATIALSFGDKITKDNLKLVKLQSDAVPVGAFRSIPAALGDGSRVAQRAISANEVLIPSAISGTGNRLSASGVIGPAMRALSVTLSESTGVGGLIAPGDHVDVYITRTPPDKAPRFDVVVAGGSAPTGGDTGAAGLGAAAGHVVNSASNAIQSASIGIDGKPMSRRAPQASLVRAAPSGEGEKSPPITDLLVQDVRVLAIGQNSNVSTDKPELVKSATLEVTPAQVSKLTLGQSVGVLTLALRPLSDKDRNAVASLHVEDLHDGPAKVTVVSSPRKAGRAVKHAEAPSVTIVRGVASTSYAVPGGN